MISFLVWPLLVLVPGASSVLVVRPSMFRRPALLVGVAPALSFATAMTTATTLGLIGFGPWPGVLLVDAALVLGAALRISGHIRADRRPEPAATGVPPDVAHRDDERLASHRRLSRWLLVCAIAFGALMWFLPGHPSIPLNRDTQNHAYYVARIERENTVNAAVVQAASPTNPTAVAAFYPLASHVTVATARHMTVQPVAELLIAWAVMSAMVVFPCGLYALGRRLAEDQPLVAGFAALAGACLAVIPYQPLVWGGVAFVVTMTVVPGVLALGLEAVDRGELALIGLTALAVLGVALAHTSELVLLVLLFSGIAAWDLGSAGSTSIRRRSALSWGALALSCAVLLTPSLLAMAAGTSERSAIAETLDEGMLDAARRLVGFDVDEGPTQWAMGILALVGVGILLLGRRRRPLGRLAPVMVTITLLAALVVLTTMSGSPWDSLRVLTIPWYQSYWRLVYNVALFAPLFVGVTLATAVGVIRRRTRRPTGAVAAAIAAAIAVLSAPVVWTTLDGTGVRDGAISPVETGLFQDLARATSDGGDGTGAGPGQTVLNQENDSTIWAYVVAGVPAFSGSGGVLGGPGSRDRAYLLDHIEDASRNERVQRLVQRWNIRYVLAADGTYSREAPKLRPDRLSRADGFHLVDQRGRYWVFEVPTSAIGVDGNRGGQNAESPAVAGDSGGGRNRT